MYEIKETPSTVLYGELQQLARISNKDAASILLSDRVLVGGKTPRERISSRTYLSREIVHVTPDKVTSAIFGDFYASTQTLYTRVLTGVGGQNASRLVLSHFSESAARRMGWALRSYGLPAELYANEVGRLMRVRIKSERDRPLLLFMLFCITGCLADPQRAVQLVEEFARNKIAQDLATVTTGVGYGSILDDDQTSLGLLRQQGGVAMPPVLPLRPEGSVIGSLATGPGAITQVDVYVSREHLRIWKEGSRWLCEGLGSTNGTTIRSAADGTVVCVEPSRVHRVQRHIYPPRELHEGDVICCGKNTQFLVLRIHASGDRW